MYPEFPPITLASTSPRRQQLFMQAGFEVQFINPNVDENFPDFLAPHQIPGFLAEKKSLAIQSDENELLVTADTIVAFDGAVLNKPTSVEEATQMLSTLSGNNHDVYTGVCIRMGKNFKVFTEKSTVYFKYLSPAFIQYYIDTCKPFDKAGAYGVQDLMGLFGVKKIDGCFYNVMGFPMSAFYDELNAFCKKHGISDVG